ncbi:MAG: helix-turn-helix transcriptional regulator [Bryobacteraceae bacterium]
MARQAALQGSLPLLVLKILNRCGPLHGYGIAAQIEARPEDILRVEEGSLYPALHRMEEAGRIKAKWATTTAIAMRASMRSPPPAESNWQAS